MDQNFPKLCFGFEAYLCCLKYVEPPKVIHVVKKHTIFDTKWFQNDTIALRSMQTKFFFGWYLKTMFFAPNALLGKSISPLPRQLAMFCFLLCVQNWFHCASIERSDLYQHHRIFEWAMNPNNGGQSRQKRIVQTSQGSMDFIVKNLLKSFYTCTGLLEMNKIRPSWIASLEK